MKVDVDAKRIAAESQECRNYTTLIRHLVGRCTSDIEKARAIFRYNGIRDTQMYGSVTAF